MIYICTGLYSRKKMQRVYALQYIPYAVHTTLTISYLYRPVSVNLCWSNFSGKNRTSQNRILFKTIKFRKC